MATEASSLVISSNENVHQAPAQNYSFFEMKAANVRLRKVLQMFQERKKVGDSSADMCYSTRIINSMFELIVEDASTIEKLSNLAVMELEQRRSANLELVLENVNLESRIKDLEYEKEYLCHNMTLAKAAYERRSGVADNRLDVGHYLREGEKLIKRCSMASDNRLVLENEELIYEVSFYLLYNIAIFYSMIINAVDDAVVEENAHKSLKKNNFCQ